MSIASGRDKGFGPVAESGELAAAVNFGKIFAWHC
mgnify:CR=1 FL=1